MEYIKKNLWIAGLVAVIILLVAVWALRTQVPNKYAPFAQCLADRGAIFYGAFWCPKCAEQKKMFGSAEKKLPYVECSTPNGKAQLPICIEKGIQLYPTWMFADGSVEKGVLPLARLAEKSGCELPQ